MSDTDTAAIQYTENRLSHALERIAELERERDELQAIRAFVATMRDTMGHAPTGNAMPHCRCLLAIAEIIDNAAREAE